MYTGSCRGLSPASAASPLPCHPPPHSLSDFSHRTTTSGRAAASQAFQQHCFLFFYTDVCHLAFPDYATPEVKWSVLPSYIKLRLKTSLPSSITGIWDRQCRMLPQFESITLLLMLSWSSSKAFPLMFIPPGPRSLPLSLEQHRTATRSYFPPLHRELRTAPRLAFSVSLSSARDVKTPHFAAS